MKKPKTINALMAYMRDVKNIQIKGSTQKKKLRYMGYFHGYKGYRYHNEPHNLFSFSSFNEIQAVYDFDMALKTMFYPEIMFLETALKNYVLEVIVDKTKSRRFADVYAQVLVAHKAFPVGSRDYKKRIDKRMGVRNKVYNLIQRDYGKRFVVNHYYDKDQPLPIWAIFELMSIGEFGTFFDCIDEQVRKEISKNVGIKSAVDNDGMMLSYVIYALKDLRNAVAHNNTIFDTRFKTSSINTRLAKYISQETGIANVTFNTIADYVILICFMMKAMDRPKSEIMAFIRVFEQNCETFRKNVASSIYMSVIYTDTRAKLKAIKAYI